MVLRLPKITDTARDPRGGYGAVAQLGERLNGIQEVGGSTPLSSTLTLTRRAFPLALCMRQSASRASCKSASGNDL
jgi:hypothetical protein